MLGHGWICPFTTFRVVNHGVLFNPGTTLWMPPLNRLL